MNTASNAGVSGCISLTTAEGSVVLCNLNVLAWRDKNEAAPLDVTGRGDTYKTYESVDEGASGFASGELRTDGYPVPAALKNQTGTLTLTFNFLQGASKSIPILITSAEFGRAKQSDATPTINVGWVATGPGTWSGFKGTQPAAAAAPTGDKQVWAGTVWTDDPQGLQTTATVRWRARAVGDTDADEWAALAAFIGAQVAPVSGLKLRPVSFERTDANGGWYTATWGLTDTADDVLLPINTSKTTPDELGNEATAAAINASPADPGVTNTVKTGSEARQLNDGKTLNVDTYGTRTIQQGIEQDGSPLTDDPQDLEDQTVVTAVTTSSTPPAASPPSGLKTRYRGTVQVDNGHWKHTYTYARRDTADDITQEGTHTLLDPAAIVSEASITVIGASETPDAPPDPPAAELTHYGTDVRQRTDAKWVWTYTYRTRSSRDEIEQDGTVVVADAQDLEDSGETTVVTNSSTPPATPSAPGTAVLTLTDTKQRTDGLWVHTFKYGPANTQQAKEYGGTTSVIDPAALRDGGTALLVNSSSTPPATPTAPGTSKLIATESTRLTAGGKWQHVFRFGAQTSADEITMGGTETRIDPNLLNAGGEITAIQSSATPATAPSAPASGSVLIDTLVKPIKDGRYAVTYRYGPRSTAQDQTFQAQVYDDPYGLDDRGQVIALQSSATPAVAPATPLSGTVFVGVTTQQLTSGEWKQTYEYRPDTSADREVNKQTKGSADPNGLDTHAFTAAINSTAAAGTGQLRSVHNFKLDNNNVLYVTETGPRSTIQDVTFPNSSVRPDPNALESREEITEVVGTGADGTGTATLEEVQPVGTIRQKLTPNYDKVTQVFEVLDSKQRRIFPKTRDAYDLYEVGEERVSPEIVDTTGVAAAITAAQGAAGSGTLTDFKYVGTVSSPETPTNGTAAGQTLLVHRYAKADTSDALTLPHATVGTDPNALDSYEVKAALWLLSDPEPSPPSTPSGLLPVETKYLNLPDDAFHQVIVYRFATNDSKTSIERPGSVYESGTRTTFESKTVEVVSCSDGDTPEDVATARFATELGGADAISLRTVAARLLTATSAEVTIIHRSAGIRLEVTGTGGLEWLNVVNSGGTLYCRTGQVKQRGTGNYEVEVVQNRVWVARMRIRIYRALMTTGGGDIDANLGFVGTCNNASFLGLPTHTVGWLGRSMIDNYDLGTTEHPYDVVDELEYRSTGIYDDAGAVAGYRTIGSSVSDYSLVAASSLGFSPAIVTGADYSPLIT